MVLWSEERLTAPAKATPDIIDTVIWRLNRGVTYAPLGAKISDRTTPNIDR